MAFSGKPSLSDAEILFEKAFGRIESAGSTMQCEGLQELKQLMRAGAISAEDIVRLMTNDRLAVIHELAQSHFAAVSEEADAILGEWVTAEEKVHGITETEVDRLQRKVAIRVAEEAFNKLSATDPQEKVQGLAMLLQMATSKQVDGKAAFMTLMMETEYKDALQRAVESSLPQVREAAQSVLDAYVGTWSSFVRGNKKPPEPFLG